MDPARTGPALRDSSHAVSFSFGMFSFSFSLTSPVLVTTKLDLGCHDSRHTRRSVRTRDAQFSHVKPPTLTTFANLEKWRKGHSIAPPILEGLLSL